MSIVVSLFTVVNNNRTRRLAAICCLVLLTVIACQSPQKHLEDKIIWKKFDDIQQTFPITGDKPLFLYLSQSNCFFCDSMETKILSRPEIAWYMNEHFTFVNINVDEDLPVKLRQDDGSYKDYNYAAFWNLFGIEGLPTYYCFDSTGGINGLLHAAQDVLTFKRFLVYVNAGHFGKTRWDDWLLTEEAKLDTLYGIF